MYEIVSFANFCDRFRACDRQDTFSREGMRLLFDWMEQYEEDSGATVELDVVGLCCNFNEMDWEDIARDYNVDLTEAEDDEEKIDAVRDYLNDKTSIVGEPSEGAFLFQVF